MTKKVTLITKVAVKVVVSWGQLHLTAPSRHPEACLAHVHLVLARKTSQMHDTFSACLSATSLSVKIASEMRMHCVV